MIFFYAIRFSCHCNCSFRVHLAALWMLSHSRDVSLRWQSLFHHNSDVMGVDNSCHISFIVGSTGFLQTLSWCADSLYFWLNCMKIDSADLFFCGKLEWRLGTGIRSTHKPQRYVSPTDTHSLGVPAFVENCFSVHFFYHFTLAVAVCVYPGLDS